MERIPQKPKGYESDAEENAGPSRRSAIFGAVLAAGSSMAAIQQPAQAEGNIIEANSEQQQYDVEEESVKPRLQSEIKKANRLLESENMSKKRAEIYTIDSVKRLVSGVSLDRIATKAVHTGETATITIQRGTVTSDGENNVRALLASVMEKIDDTSPGAQIIYEYLSGSGYRPTINTNELKENLDPSSVTESVPERRNGEESDSPYKVQPKFPAGW